MLRDREFIG